MIVHELGNKIHIRIEITMISKNVIKSSNG